MNYNKRHSPAEFRQAYKNLPEPTKNALENLDSTAILTGIGNRRRLHVDQMGGLADEIGYVMVGLEKSSDFVKNVSERLGISQNEAEQIGMEVNKEIFLKIRESLQAMEEGRMSAPATVVVPEETLPAEPTPTPEPPTPATLDAAPSLLERKLSEPVSQQARETVVESAPKPIEHVDPYREPVE